MCFDGFVEDQGKCDCGNCCYDYVDCKMLLVWVIWQIFDYVDDFVMEFLVYCQDGVELDYDFEDFVFFVIEVEQLVSEDQMVGVGNGEEFGQVFDDVENQCFDGECDIYVISKEEEENEVLGVQQKFRVVWFECVCFWVKL